MPQQFRGVRGKVHCAPVTRHVSGQPSTVTANARSRSSGRLTQEANSAALAALERLLNHQENLEVVREASHQQT